MFSGIVESVGTIVNTTVVPGGRRLRVEVGPWARDCALGTSICVSGVCLTVAATSGNALEFDAISETLGKSTLGSKRSGDRVNIERAVGVGDRFDGHFVQGHVDGTGAVGRVQSSAREWVAWIRPQPQLTPYIIPQGSVAVDGVSLTIADVRAWEFAVALIPTTLEQTTLASLVAGDLVNIESDIIARTIVHRLSQVTGGRGLTLESLREAGFV